MEILVHVSAPSSARDDARYRAQVAAISSAFEPVSLISDDQHHHHHHRDGLPLVPAGRPPPPPADAPETAENAEPAEPADSSLLLQVPELISAPDSVSSLAGGNASAAIADQARQTSSDSPCDRDLKDLDQDLRRKNPLCPGNPPLPRAEEGCFKPNPGGNGTATATANTIETPNSNTNPCPWRNHQPIPPIPSPGTNQSRPNPPVPAPDQTRESDWQIAAINAQPQIAPDSLGSLISVIPDSQPELSVSVYAQHSCQSATRSAAQLHEDDDQPSRSPKRRRVQPCSPRPQTGQGQTISKIAASESTVTVTLDSAHHAEKALSTHGDEGPPSPAPSAQGAYPHPPSHTHPNNSPFRTHAPNPNPVSADSDPVVSVTETSHHHQQEEEEQHQHQHQHITILSTLPLSLQPPPPPISTSTFTTHITPTLSMLTQRLKPARTYKPTHQARELDKLERGYWAMHINIVPNAAPTPAHDQAQPYTKDGAGASPDPGSDLPQTWTEIQLTHFWTFLSDFIAKEARAGWGVWCIVDRAKDQPHSPRTHSHTDANIAGNTTIPVQLKVYAWGEVAMHIYLMLYLASERRVRGMGLRWVDSREEVVIQMP